MFHCHHRIYDRTHWEAFSWRHLDGVSRLLHKIFGYPTERKDIYFMYSQLGLETQ